MPKTLKMAAFSAAIVAAILVFAKDGAAQLDVHGSSAARTIYPAGGSDGPPNL